MNYEISGRRFGTAVRMLVIGDDGRRNQCHDAVRLTVACPQTESTVRAGAS